jgi:hypothetical protein
MSTEFSYNVFPEYVSQYSAPVQKQVQELNDIIHAGTHVGFNTNNLTLSQAEESILNPNLPVIKKTRVVNIDNKPVEVHDPFWNYNQFAGSIFTNYESAGTRQLKEDIGVRDLKLPGMQESNSTYILSNSNNVRNVMQQNGKTILNVTNLLNMEAFYNGLNNDFVSGSSYRPDTISDITVAQHSAGINSNNGDKFSRQVKQLRVDLPVGYQEDISTWQYLNPILVIPSSQSGLDNLEKFQLGTFYLDDFKKIGRPCLTSSFNIVQPNSTTPTDVYTDKVDSYPPITSPCLFCSVNTNFVTMPLNTEHTNLDATMAVFNGSNSTTIGQVLSPNLKQYINNELYDINKKQLLLSLVTNNTNVQNKYKLSNTDLNYNKKTEYDKYQTLVNYQLSIYNDSLTKYSQEVSKFILKLNIFKFKGTAIIDNVAYKLNNDGAFLLLPSMLSTDLFNIKENSEGTCLPGNQIDCCFQGPAGAWISPQPPKYVQTLPNNVSNLVNFGCGSDPFATVANF